MLKLPNKPFPVIQKFLQENEPLVYWYMVLSIAKAIDSRADKTELFSFGSESENIAIVKKKDYERVLSDAIMHFSNVEEYEHAAYARDVLSKWKIENLINDNTTE